MLSITRPFSVAVHGDGLQSVMKVIHFDLGDNTFLGKDHTNVSIPTLAPRDHTVSLFQGAVHNCGQPDKQSAGRAMLPLIHTGVAAVPTHRGRYLL